MQMFVNDQLNNPDQIEPYQNTNTGLQIISDQWDFQLLHTVEEVIHGLTEIIQVY